MTSIAYDFKAIKHRIDQMNGEAPSGTYYRQDESGKVELCDGGHDWFSQPPFGVFDRCSRCGYYLAEWHDNLAPKVCPGKIDGEPCSECGANAVANFKSGEVAYARCLKCQHRWDGNGAQRRRKAIRTLLDSFLMRTEPSGITGHNWQTRSDVTDCTACGFRPNELCGQMECRGHKPEVYLCSVCEECGCKSVLSFFSPGRYSRCFSCRHSFYPVPAPKRKEWMLPAVTVSPTMTDLLRDMDKYRQQMIHATGFGALGRLNSKPWTVTNGGNTPTFVFDPATGQRTEIKPGQTKEFDKNLRCIDAPISEEGQQMASYAATLGGLVKVDPSRPPAAQLTSEGLRIKREAAYHDFQSVASGEAYGEARIAKAFGWHSPEHKAFYPQHAENCDCDVCIPF